MATLELALQWLLSGGVALAQDPTAQCAALLNQPDEAQQLAHEVAAAARKKRDARDTAGALAGLRLAVALDPRDVGLADELAVQELAAGHPKTAEELWLAAVALQPEHPAVRLHLAEQWAVRGATDDLNRAADTLSRGLRDAPILRMQAEVAARRGLCGEAEAFGENWLKLAGKKATAAQIGALAAWRGDCQFGAGAYPAAQALYDEAAAQGVDVTARQEALRVARTRIAAPPVQAPKGARPQLMAMARTMLDQVAKGQEPPEGDLARHVADDPTVALGHLALAELLAVRKDFAAAELRYLRALQLGLAGADRSRALVGLGRLLLHWPEPARLQEAAAILQVAAESAPQPPDVQIDLLTALRSTGQLRAARRVADKLLQTPEALQQSQLRDVTAIRHDLALAPPTDAQAEVTAAVGPDIAAAAAQLAAGDHYQQACALLADHIARNGPRVDWLTDLATYRRGMGDHPAAIEALQQALALEPKRADLHARLAGWLAQAGRTGLANQHLRQAVAQGRDELVPTVAALDADELPDGWWADLTERREIARIVRMLDQFAARRALEKAPDPALQADALALRQTLQLRLDRAWWVLVVGVALLSLVGFAWANKRYGGRDLRYLLAEHPDTGPEILRVLAAVRHEVLKHNTMRLQALVDAIGRGDSTVSQQLLAALLGGSGDGALDHLHGYRAELERIGRARGVRLNLRHRDAAFAPLFGGFAQLRQVQRSTGSLAVAGRRRRLQAKVRWAARMLNANGYEAVRNLLDNLRLVRLDSVVIGAAFDHVRSEPAFAQATIAPLTVDLSGDAPFVAVPHAVLAEVFVNLLRNALHASTGQLPVRLGVSVAVQTDPITALETVCVAVQDAALGQLTDDDIARRPVDRGLGLVRARLAVYEGGLTVHPAPPPWRKAVVVRLPRAYAGES